MIIIRNMFISLGYTLCWNKLKPPTRENWGAMVASINIEGEPTTKLLGDADRVHVLFMYCYSKNDKNWGLSCKELGFVHNMLEIVNLLNIVELNTILCIINIMLYIISYHIILYYIILHYIISYHIILYYIILNYMI